VVSASARGLDFMVKHNIKGAVGGGAATMEQGPITAFQAAAHRAGKDWKLGENLMIGIVIHLADSKAQALKELVPLYEEHAKMFAPLGFMPGMTKDQIAAVARRGGWYSAGVPTVEHYINLGGWFAGTSEELVAYLKHIETRYPGLEHINLSMPMGTPQSIMLDQYRRVSAEVMPHFRH
jgi:alkanesulfonate monooxygenase SsuD/methylene tetrahydromethanopterin reductase-like flavin-dependent oxidoreductase (luciferase family)